MKVCLKRQKKMAENAGPNKAERVEVDFFLMMIFFHIFSMSDVEGAVYAPL